MTTGKRLLAKLSPLIVLFRAIGNKYRTAIVYTLLSGPSTPSVISRILHISQPLIAHHIAILSRAGWIKRMRIGKTVTYSLSKKPFREIKKTLEQFPNEAGY